MPKTRKYQKSNRKTRKTNKTRNKRIKKIKAKKTLKRRMVGGTNPDDELHNKLMEAVKRGSGEELKKILQEIAYKTAQYSNNVQERIINRRVDSETNDNDFSVGDTAFYYACEKGHEEVVKKLLNSSFANKIDMNQSDRENGITPLFAACFYNHVGIVKLLLSRPDKIDVNKKTTDDDMTPLYVACEKNHKEVVEELLKHPDIDVNIATKYGQIPLSVAYDKKHLDVHKLLIEHYSTKMK
tara:strand:+ start:2594 stop:3313 length:720 start_codon:yes stop_codon:yes gene_type:complete